MKTRIKVIGILSGLVLLLVFFVIQLRERSNSSATFNGNIVQNNSGQMIINQNVITIESHRDLRIEISSGMKYVDARKILINSGWQATNRHILLNLTPVCWDYDWNGFRRCDFPEVDDCSGTGMGFCLMYFYNTFQKSWLRIRTKGGPPPEYAIIDQWVLEEDIDPAEYHRPK